MLRAFVVAGYASLLCAAVGALAWGDGPASFGGCSSGYDSSRWAGSPVQSGMSWAIGMWPDSTTVDALPLRAMLVGHSRQMVAFDLYPETKPTRIVLTKGDGTRVERDMVWYRDCRRFFWPGRVGGGMLTRAYEFEIDLKEMFGKFTPGDYKVRVVLPAEGYAITGQPAPSRVDIRSNELAFTVVEPDHSAIMAAHAQRLKARSDVVPPGPWAVRKGDGTAVLTNGLPFPVLVPFKHKNSDLNETAEEAAVVPYGHILRWHPTRSWVTPRLMGGGQLPDVGLSSRHLRERGWSLRSLEPSESMTIALPDQSLQDGIYCYDVLVFQERERGPDRSHLLAGTPFVVEDGRIEAFRAVDEQEPGD